MITLDQLSTLFFVFAAATVLLTTALERKVYRLERRLSDTGGEGTGRCASRAEGVRR